MMAKETRKGLGRVGAGRYLIDTESNILMRPCSNVLAGMKPDGFTPLKGD